MFLASDGMNLIRTGPDAGTATGATILGAGQMSFGHDALGIMAPKAIEGTALKENRGADSRSIVDAETLDVEDATLHGLCRILGRWRAKVGGETPFGGAQTLAIGTPGDGFSLPRIMPDSLLVGGSFLLALLGFGFVIFIHELGHFLFAKWVKVRVDAFSVGFPPTIFKWKYGETEYRIGLIPFGGYVKMLGQEDVPSGKDIEKLDPASYLAKPRWARALILFGGVLFNLLSSVIILLCLVWFHASHMPAVVGQVLTQVRVVQKDGSDGSATAPATLLGLHEGDRIRRINGHRIDHFTDVTFVALGLSEEPIKVEIERGGKILELAGPDGQGVLVPRDPIRGFPTLGIAAADSLKIADVVDSAARVKANDEIIAVEDEDVTKRPASEVKRLLTQREGLGQTTKLRLKRGNQEITVSARFSLSSYGSAGQIFGLPVYIAGVAATDSPAKDAGIERGDIITSVDGTTITSIPQCTTLVERSEGRPLKLGIQRLVAGSWQNLELSVAPRLKQTDNQYRMGVNLDYRTGSATTVAFVAGSVQEPDKTKISIETLSGATIGRIRLSAEGQRIMQQTQRAGTLKKLLGFKDTLSMEAQLLNATVVSTNDGNGFPGPGQITVMKKGQSIVLELGQLPLDDQKALLSLPKNACVISESLESAPDGFVMEYALGGTRQTITKPVIEADQIAIMLSPYMEPQRLESFTDAFAYTAVQSERMIVGTLRLIPRFFKKAEQGGINAEQSLSGPVGIFMGLAKINQHTGFGSFLRFVALIGLNLFLINLLPIPITDGGQLLFLGIEKLIGRPVPVKIQNIFLWMGLALVLALMIFSLGLDISRLIHGW